MMEFLLEAAPEFLVSVLAEGAAPAAAEVVAPALAPAAVVEGLEAAGVVTVPLPAAGWVVAAGGVTPVAVAAPLV